MVLFVTPVSEPALPTTPLFTGRYLTGFPLSVADYTEDEPDLNAYCIHRPSATCSARVIDDSMKDTGSHPGNLMAVDKIERPMWRNIVITETDGEFTTKRLQLKSRIALLPMNLAYPTLYLKELQIFGVVMAFIHKTRGSN